MVSSYLGLIQVFSDTNDYRPFTSGKQAFHGCSFHKFVRSAFNLFSLHSMNRLWKNVKKKSCQKIPPGEANSFQQTTLFSWCPLLWHCKSIILFVFSPVFFCQTLHCCGAGSISFISVVPAFNSKWVDTKWFWNKLMSLYTWKWLWSGHKVYFLRFRLLKLTENFISAVTFSPNIL